MDTVNISVIENVETVTISVVTGFATVVNSDATYTKQAPVDATTVLPNITVTNSDGSTYSYPSVKDVVCSAPVGSDVENSDGSYTQHVNNGATLVLPDTIIKNTAGATILTQPSCINTGVVADCRVVNSDLSYDELVPAETTHNLADVPNVDSDGSTVMTPAMTPFVATPSTPPGEQFYVLFPSLYKSTVDMAVDASSAGTYAYEQSANTSSVAYKVNGGAVTMPFTVVNGDTLTVTIVKVDEDCLAVVEITNISVTPYTFTAGNFISAYPPSQNDTYVKATSKFSTDYWPYYSTDPSKSLIGAFGLNQWISAQGSTTNQRFHIDLGSAKTIGRLYYENMHYIGTDAIFASAGCKDVQIFGSNNVADFNDLTYANDGTWIEMTGLTQSYLDMHILLNQPDPKYIIFNNTTAYRYWCLKFANNWGNTNYMGVRRIELQE